MTTLSTRCLSANHDTASESARLQALHDLNILDTQPESHFDELTAFAREAFGGVEAELTLVSAGCVYIKSSSNGWAGKSVLRSESFCPHTILQEDTLVVLNATRDARFWDNPFVKGDTHIRFYAGFPLQISNGHKLGAFCIVGTQPRETFTAEEQAMLRRLARQAAEYIEERTQGDDHESAASYRGDLAESGTGLILLNKASSLQHANIAGTIWFESIASSRGRALPVLRDAVKDAGKLRKPVFRSLSFGNQSFLVEIWPLGSKFGLIVHEVMYIPGAVHEPEMPEAEPHPIRHSRGKSSPLFWALHPTHSS